MSTKQPCTLWPGEWLVVLRQCRNVYSRCAPPDSELHGQANFLMCFLFNFALLIMIVVCFHPCSDDDTNDYKRLFDHGKHLSKEDKEVLLGIHAQMYNEDSNLSFEREMENEARNHINGFHVNESPGQMGNHSIRTDPASVDVVVPVASTSKTKEQQNDELFYDPDEDERDQAWADSHRSQKSGLASIGLPLPRSERQKRLQELSKLKKAQSDATLNCPCCLTLLSLDCQRHDIYKTQYRAMLVINCRIDYTKKLLYRDKEQRKNQFKRSKKHRNPQAIDAEASTQGQDQTTAAESDLYYPVHCCTCNTQVALYDIDQVYHFFSVLASH